MAACPALIYCAGGNRKLDAIALSAGFRYGLRLPYTAYHPVYFADQNWKKPNRAAYMAALQKHRPVMATVLDWEEKSQFLEVIDWAEEASQHVQESVVIIPKVYDGTTRLPRRVSGKRVVLGYSVPTRHGATSLGLWEFAGWPVHLLGGTPHAQIQLFWQLGGMSEIVSCDGNVAERMAVRYCKWWERGTWRGGLRGEDACYEAFARSCHHIIAAWQRQGTFSPLLNEEHLETESGPGGGPK